MKRGRWAGHVKKVRASANGTSNLRPRVVAAASKPTHAADGMTAALVFHGGSIGGGGGGATNGVLRTFTALFDALGAAEKGLPPERAEDAAAVAAVAGAGTQGPGCAAEQGFQLFSSKWLQAGGHFPRIISIRPDLFCSLGGSPTVSLPLPVVPLFR